MSQTQTTNAWTIVDVARRRNLPHQAAIVAIATALQESNLQNLASGAVPASRRMPPVKMPPSAEVRRHSPGEKHE